MTRHLSLGAPAPADETADTRTLTFELPPAAVERFAFREGQYATLVMDIHRWGCWVLPFGFWVRPARVCSGAGGPKHEFINPPALAGKPWLACRSEVRRPYSISSCPSQLPRLSITVKRLPGGMASTHLHTLAPGAVVHLLPPAGDFVLQPLPSPAGIHLFFAAGSGIAPTLPMLRAALAGGEAGALLYCSRRQGEVIFSAQLQQLQQEQRAAGSAAGLLAVQHCLSKGAAVSPQQVPDVAGSLQEGVKCQGGSGARVCVLADASSHPVPPEPAAGSAHMPDEDWHGRLTPARVQSFLNSVLARASSAAGPPAAAGDSVQCYMCGPLDWMNMIRDALQAAGEGVCGCSRLLAPVGSRFRRLPMTPRPGPGMHPSCGAHACSNRPGLAGVLPCRRAALRHPC